MFWPPRLTAQQAPNTAIMFITRPLLLLKKNLPVKGEGLDITVKWANSGVVRQV